MHPPPPQIRKEKAKKRYVSKKGETGQSDTESTIILNERMPTLKRFNYKKIKIISIYLSTTLPNSVVEKFTSIAKT